MRLALAAALLCSLIGFSASGLSASTLPKCNVHVLRRRGTQVSTSMAELGRMLNQRLQAAHSDVTDLRLSPAGNGRLRVAAKKNGTPMSMSGPLTATGGPMVRLHADQITKNGSSVKGMMDLFGKNLGDYLHLHKVNSLSVQGNDLNLNVDLLLGLASDVRKVTVQGSRIEMDFISQPCR